MGLEWIKEYISYRHTSVAIYITTRMIFYIVVTEEQRRVPIVHAIVGTGGGMVC